MVIDSSAIVAILQEEPEMDIFLALLNADSTRLMSAASYAESAIIIEDRYGYEGMRDFKLLITEAGVEVEPVTYEQAELAHEAYRQYGRGNHPARLNFGDCFAFALARMTDEPLLYKGDDFSKTDIASATARPAEPGQD
jgi:ribonuclease VapC